MVEGSVAADVAEITKHLKIEWPKVVPLKLGCEGIEWVVCGVNIGHDTNPKGKPVHRLEFSGLTIRAVEPVDWLAFLRQWGVDFEEVREGRLVYHKVKGPMVDCLGLTSCVYLPDDRTLVFEEQKTFRKLAARESPSSPAYLRGADWERVARGLFALAVDNRDGAFAKSYNLARPDDAVVLSLFEGVERWVFGVDDAITLQGAAIVRDGGSGESIARAVESLRKTGLASLDFIANDAQAIRGHEQAARVAKAFLDKLHLEHSDLSIGLRVEGFATLPEIASMINFENEGAGARNAATDPKSLKR